MKKPSPEKLTFFPVQFLLLFFVFAYVLLFFATSFEPYHTVRAAFFSYLLLPEEYFSYWTGSNGVVSVTDRLPVLLRLFLCLLAAYGIGCPLIKWTMGTILTQLEYTLFSIVAGLSSISILLFWFCFLNPHKSFETLWLFSIFIFLFSYVILIVHEIHRQNTAVRAVTVTLLDTLKNTRNHSVTVAALITVFIFSLLIILSGMIPSTDYDVLSYHLAGAREFAEAGRIGFLPHNVYANMPFGAEMFYVWGMAQTGDFFTGAMVGKTLIASTTILTALGLYAFGKRFFSETAGLVAMILYITMPWIIYVSTVGLIDSVVGMYAFFTIYAVFISTKKSSIFLAGFFAGSAAACKYPAMLFIVIPMGIYLLLRAKARRHEENNSLPMTAIVYGLAVLLACGGWYFKNYYYTGNPVYPLCFSIFGDSTGLWTPEINARWTQIHSPHDFSPVTFAKDFWRVGMSSPWNAPLLIPFFLLVFVTKETWGKRRIIWLLPGWLVFVFVSWWFLTHRIDRFWLPAIPVMAMIAGIGATWQNEKRWKITVAGLLILSGVYCFLVGGAAAPGKNNQLLVSLDSMRHDENMMTPWSVWFNGHLPENKGKILLIGEAKAFLYDVPILYNTCFNETPLKEIASTADPRKELRKRDIAFVLVDWSEIARFRSPGNYGYSEFVQPNVFDKLVADGILERYCPDEELAKTSTVVYRVIERH